MKNILLALLVAAGPASAATNLTGAGATFPYPIYSKWFDEYHKVKPDIEINYQSIGSGGGIKQITDRLIDFGATDGPMTDKQMFKIDGKLLHIPTVIGAVVPAYNLPGVDKLNLSGPLLADIYLGKVKRWNDPAIAKENPGAKLPDAGIVVARRADGSGTTYVFVDYLSKMSPEWEKKVGRGTSVNWPVGLGGKGNEGVSAIIKGTEGSLGYIELIYAKQNGVSHAAVKNAAGKYVKADIDAVAKAAAGVKMPKDFRVSITNPAGDDAYPIASFTWLLVYEKNAENKGAILKDFLRWMLKDGQPMASQLGYAPLPKSVNEMVAKTVETIR